MAKRAAEIDFKRIQDKNLTPEIIVAKAKEKGKNLNIHDAERLLKKARREIKEKSYNEFMHNFLYDGGKHFGVLSQEQLDDIHAMGNGVPGIWDLPRKEWDDDWFYDNIFDSTFERKKKIVNTILDCLNSNKANDTEWDGYFIPLTDEEEEIIDSIEDTNASRHEEGNNQHGSL